MDYTIQEKISMYITSIFKELGRNRFFVNTNNTLSTTKKEDNLDLIDFMIRCGHDFICWDGYKDFMKIFNEKNNMDKLLKFQKVYNNFIDIYGYEFVRKKNVYLNYIDDNNFSIEIFPKKDSFEIKNILFEMSLTLIINIDITESVNFEPTKYMNLEPKDNKKSMLQKIRSLIIGLIPPSWFGTVTDDFFSVLSKNYDFEKIYVMQNGEITLTFEKSAVRLNIFLTNCSETIKGKLRDNILVFCCN